MATNIVSVDTSIWIEFFKKQNLNIFKILSELLKKNLVVIAVPVWIEILAGCNKKDYDKIAAIFSIIPKVYPVKETWDRIEVWIKKSKSAGENFVLADLLIASICKDHNFTIWSLDHDFRRMSELDFIKTYL